MKIDIHLAGTAADLARAYPVVVELRPHLDEAAFLARAIRQQAQGWRLAMLELEREVRAVAGFRVQENLAWGRFLYVDDLVTRAADRSRGLGAALLDWLSQLARAEGCVQLHLDSGVQRLEAHRFYAARGMRLTSHHFAIPL